MRFTQLLFIFSFFVASNLYASVLPDSLVNQLNQSNSYTEKAKTLRKIAVYYSDECEDFESALPYYLRSARMAMLAGENEMMGNLYNNTGVCYEMRGMHDSSIYYFNAAGRIFKTIEDSVGVAFAYKNMGLVYEFSGDYESSMEQYVKFAKMSDALNDSIYIIDSYLSLGGVYREMEQYEKASTYFESALKLNHLVKDDVMYARLYNQIAMLEKYKGNYDTAIEMYQKTFAYSEKINWKKGMAAALSNIGNVYMLLEDYDVALNFHLESLEMEEELNHHYGMMCSKNTLGELYYLLGNFSKSETYLNEALAMAEDENNHDLLSKVYAHLIDLYKAEGKSELAIAAYDEMIAHKDSLYNAESVQKISEVETKYQTRKKENEIKLLSVENQLKDSQNLRQKSFIRMLVLILLLIIASSIMFFVMYLKKQRAYQSLVKQNVAAAEADIKLAKCNADDSSEKVSLSDEKKDELIPEIERLMMKEKIFEQSDLSLESFSKALNSNRQYVSQLINEKYKKSFTQFVNEFRIRQARIYLTSDAYDKYTLEGIAGLVGFHSRSAFIASFKKFTGVTPSFYKKNKNL